MPVVRLHWPVSVTLAAAILAGCGSGDTGVQVPALEIRTTTAGTELDPDGYSVTIDDGPGKPMGLVDSLIVDPLSAGEHSVTLGGLADNCRSRAAPPSRDRGGRQDRHRRLRRDVRGHPRPDPGDDRDDRGQPGHGWVRGPARRHRAGPIGPNDSLPLSGVAPGDHLVTLGGIATNCAVDGDNPRTVRVTAGGEDSVSFTVTCIRPVGQIRVEVTSSGAPADPDGYVITLDRAVPGVPIGISDTVDLADVPAGSHSVTLEGLASNCSLQSANPVQLEVPLGGSVVAAFAVSCLGASQVIAFSANAPGLLAVFLVSPDGTGLLRLTPDPLLERDPKWSPDGRRLLVVRVDPSFQSEALYVMNADGSGRTELANGASLLDYRWSPDGSRIAFSLGRVVRNNLVSDLWVMQADGSGKSRLATNAEGATWSPDGQRIAYVRDVGNIHIRIVNAAGGDDHRLTDDSMNAIQPAWSPDGSRIAFVSLDPNEIRVINPDGTGLLNLTQGIAQEDGPVWSPDGSRIAFNSGPTDQPLESEVTVIHPDGSGRMNLTHHPGFDLSPDWSPDGKRIVFVRTDNGDNEIYVMNSDGSDPTDISNRPDSFESAPDWSGQPPAALAGPLAGLNTTVRRAERLKDGRTEGPAHRRRDRQLGRR
jgi:Periplasmic component of the Tol biopolymer transport system